MWQDKLKQIKKHTKLKQKSLIENKQQAENLEMDISFNNYCQKNNVIALNNDTVELKPLNNKTKIILDDAFNKRNSRGFDFFDELASDIVFFRNGQRNLPKELRNEKFKINAVLDLHNFNKAHAIELLEQFINKNLELKSSCLKVIHGSGQNSKNNQPVLINIVRRYLQNIPQVVAYSYGGIKQGGNGVTIIKLSNKS